jgi:hypothetical protein
MSYRTFFYNIIIFGFMALVGFCIAMAIQSQSFIGLTLAITSLCAGIYFLYLLNKARNISETGHKEAI